MAARHSIRSKPGKAVIRVRCGNHPAPRPVKGGKADGFLSSMDFSCKAEADVRCSRRVAAKPGNQ